MPAFDGPQPVVRMQKFAPSVSLRVLERRTHVLEPASVEVVVIAVGLGSPDQLRRRVCEQPELPLAFAKGDFCRTPRFLRLLLPVYIVEGGYCPNDLARVVVDGSGAGADPPARPVATLVEDLIAGDALSFQRSRQRPPFRLEPPSDRLIADPLRVLRHCGQVVDRMPQNQFQLSVPQEDPASRRFGQKYTRRDVIDQSAQAGSLDFGDMGKFFDSETRQYQVADVVRMDQDAVHLAELVAGGLKHERVVGDLAPAPAQGNRWFVAAGALLSGAIDLIEQLEKALACIVRQGFPHALAEKIAGRDTDHGTILEVGKLEDMFRPAQHGDHCGSF